MKFYFIVVLGFFQLAVNASPVDSLLKANHCSLTLRLNQYDYNRFNRSVKEEHYSFWLSGSQRIEFNDLSWNVTCKYEKREDNCFDFHVEYVLLEGESRQTAPSIDINFGNWSADNYVLLPGAAYNGNRFESRRIRYSPKLMDPRDIGEHVAPIVSDVPRLNHEEGPSVIQERSGSMTVPSAGFHQPGTKKGCWLLFEQKNTWGDYGLTIEENRDRNQAVFSITSPVVREKYKYRITDLRYPSDDRAPDINAGDRISFHIRLYFFDSPDIQSLYSTFFNIRKDFVPASTQNYTIPFSACFEVQEKKFNEQNYVDQHGYYAVGMRNGKYPFLQDWQIGWTGGMISTYPLLFEGNERTELRVLNNFDFLFPEGVCPAGFFWDAGESKDDGFHWYGGDIRKYNTKNWHLIRKSGDAVYYIVKQFMLMELKEIPVKTEWKQGVQRVCDTLVSLWERNNQFGQFVHSETAQIQVGGSTSGAIIPAALVLASQYFNSPKYMEVANQSAEYYYNVYIKKGLTMGGPGDAMQNPDSESSYAMLESFIQLHEATKSKKWLDMAEDMAKQFSSWVMAYDYTFPPASTLGKLGIKTTGAVFANTQNKHGAPGICTHSGIALLRLYRATGKKQYLQLLKDITTHIPQNLSHPERPIEGMNEGWMSERVSTTDWLEGIGELMYGSTWAETALMLTNIEIPGIYIQPDKSYLCVFDQVTAKVIKDNRRELIIEISNPTQLNAIVKILSENESEYSKPLGENRLFNTETIEIAPGERKLLRYMK